MGGGEVSFVGPSGFLVLMAFLPLVFFPFLPNIRGAQVFSDLCHVLVLNTGFTSLHLSHLDRMCLRKITMTIYMTNSFKGCTKL